MRVPRLALALAVATLLGGALAGCTGSPLDSVVEGAVNEGIEQLEGGIEGLVSEALGGAEVSTDGTLPGTFPDSVPLVDGTVLGGGAGPAGSGWVANVEVASVAAFEDARALLEQAGYTGAAVSSDADSAFGTFTGPQYTVVLTVATQADGTTVATYVVTPQ